VEYSTLSPENLAIHCFHSTDETAWAEFVRRFHPLIARVAIRVAREWGEESKQVVDDLIQDTYLKLFENRRDLAERFKPAHTDAIFGYIQVFTTNLVHDRFKASRSQKRGGGLTTSLGDKSEDAFSLKKSLSPPLADLDRVVLILRRGRKLLDAIGNFVDAVGGGDDLQCRGIGAGLVVHRRQRVADRLQLRDDILGGPRVGIAGLAAPGKRDQRHQRHRNDAVPV